LTLIDKKTLKMKKEGFAGDVSNLERDTTNTPALHRKQMHSFLFL
jgi:hypothetical protein